jgi:hypothetical protein
MYAKLRQVQRDWSRASRTLMRYGVAQWFGGMQHSSAGAWHHVKRGFVTAYGELESAFVKAAKEFERG